jgi:hypothetical protein
VLPSVGRGEVVVISITVGPSRCGGGGGGVVECGWGDDGLGRSDGCQRLHQVVLVKTAQEGSLFVVVVEAKETLVVFSIVSTLHHGGRARAPSHKICGGTRYCAWCV